jgi:hypothetical protein
LFDNGLLMLELQVIAQRAALLAHLFTGLRNIHGSCVAGLK